jgi:hypothetical protein
MRKLTVSVPDHVYRLMQAQAARQRLSVGELAAKYLSSLVAEDDEFERLLEQEEEVLAEIEDFAAGDRLDRDEVHRRGLAEELDEIARHSASLPVLDSRSEDEILDYDEDGVPR